MNILHHEENDKKQKSVCDKKAQKVLNLTMRYDEFVPKVLRRV